MPRKHLKGQFIDSLRLHVKGGSGGNGIPKYGGIGGKGGDVYVIAKEGNNFFNKALINENNFNTYIETVIK